MRPAVGSKVLIGRFEITRPLRLLDVEALESIRLRGSLFDPSFGPRLERIKFLESLSKRISMPVLPDDEPFDYLATQAVAEFLAAEINPPIDGIVYPSVQAADAAKNVVLFHKSARVKRFEIPGGTEIRATLYDETDEGNRINCWVTEEVPPPEPPAPPRRIRLGFPFPAPPPVAPGTPAEDEFDYREASLRLDEKTIESFAS